MPRYFSCSLVHAHFVLISNDVLLTEMGDKFDYHMKLSPSLTGSASLTGMALIPKFYFKEKLFGSSKGQAAKGRP